jgi:ribosomal protein S18 acetylase RimI-like enzyme
MSKISMVELNGGDRERAAELEDLAREIWTEHYTPIIGAEQVSYMLSNMQNADSILKAVESENYRYFIVYDGSKPTGYFAVKPEADGKTLLLSKLYLHKDCRGRGISRLILEKVRLMAREYGLEHIQLFVNKHNSTVNIYKKLGFRIVEDVVTDIGGGFVMDDYRMMLDV